MNNEERSHSSFDGQTQLLNGQMLSADFVIQAKAQLEVLERQMRKLDEQLSVVQGERSRKGVMIRHLRGLLDVQGEDEEEGSRETPAYGSILGQRLSDADRVVEYLQESGSAAHYRKIYEDLKEVGVVAGGKDPALTLLSRFYRDPRLMRVGRGTYRFKA